MIINAKNNATKPNKEKMIKEGLLTIAMLASMPVMAQKTSTAVLHPDQAKEKIKTTNMPNTMWQMAILNLLEQYPETADFFNRL